MKLVIVLFAVVAVASAYPGAIPWVDHVAVKSSGWQQPSGWQSSGYQVSAGWQPSGGHQSAGWQPSGWQPSGWVAPQPKYIKIAAPAVHAQVHQAPQVHHVINVPQPAPIPPVHPQPLNLKVHSQAVRIPLGHVKVPYPHLIGIEANVPEPEIKIVKSHHPW